MQDTMPMTLDALGAPGATDEFRIGAPREILALLRRLRDANTPMQLHAASGDTLDATLWTIDAERASLGFDLGFDHGTAAHLAQAALDGRSLTAVGYLDSVKVQFTTDDPALVHGARSSVLTCALPRELFRFQRRGAYRVRPPMRSSPVARLRPGAGNAAPLELRVLDVSIGGCALFLAHDAEPMPPGSLFDAVEIDLDTDVHLRVALRLQHVSSLGANAGGVRLGCEFVRPDATTQRTLQRFIDLTQQRGKLLSVG